MKSDLSALGEQIRLAYAEHLIRCNDPDPEDMEELLSLDGEHEQARRWLAFGYAKRRYDPDHIRGLLVYFVSQYYPARSPDPARRHLLLNAIRQSKITLSELTVEKLCGTYLNWEEVFRLLGKEFNPSRAKDHVHTIYRELTEKSAPKE